MRVDVGRVLDQPAQAVGGRRHQRKTEGRGFALDVVGGVEQRFLVGLGEAGFDDGVARLVEPLAFGFHPVDEFARQLGQRLFGARDRIVFAGQIRPRRDRLAQLVFRRDDLVVAVGRDRRGVFAARPCGLFLCQPGVRTFSSKGAWRMTSALPPLRRSGPT